MKIFLGLLMYVAAIMFGSCFIATFVCATWSTRYFPDLELTQVKVIAGYFGFGLPLAASWAATGMLWAQSKFLTRFLGFTCGLFALGCAGCLVFALGDWMLENKEHPILNLLVFGVAALASGAFGVRVLLEAES